MGLCFSKKRKEEKEKDEADDKKAEMPPQKAVEATAEKKHQVFVSSKCLVTLADEGEKRGVKPVKDAGEEIEVEVKGGVPVSVVVEGIKPSAVVRTSSCTNEEVDAILIQCGRLSRSSSGNASNEGGLGHRKHSGSKRSYDFDNERVGDEEKAASRPSPRRRAPSRDRSGSRERSGSGGRRVSRSPGRRSEALSGASSCDNSKQPTKMVAVPAREKGRGASPCSTHKRGGTSPRSRSPASASWMLSNENAASNQVQCLSLSSSRKTERSPFRRNPMAEIDENSLKTGQNLSIDHKKSSERSAQITKSLQRTEATEEIQNNNMESELVEKTSSKVTAASTNLEVENHQLKTISAIRSSRRTPSRDLDQIPSRNSYSSSLPEGIHNAAFSLPACLSKACSILEAVADLNSTGGHSTSAGNMFDEWGERRGSFVETEIVVKDDLMEPSIHRYVTVRQSRAELEPQESAGSNSFVGHPWAAASSGREPDSVDSASRWRSNDDEEVEQEAKMSSLSQKKQRRRPRCTINGSGNGHPPPELSENKSGGKGNRTQISGLSATAAPTATI